MFTFGRLEAVHPRLVSRALGVLVRNFLDEQERWPVWLPVLLGLGVAVYFALPVEPPQWLMFPWLPFALGAAVLRRRDYTVYLVLLTLAVLLLGMGAAQWRSQSVAAPVLSRSTGPVMVSGLVEDVMRGEGASARLVIINPVIDRLEAGDTPYRVRITARFGADDIHPGQHIRVRAVLMPPSPPIAPGAFNYARMAWFQRLGGLGYTVGQVTVIEEAGDQGGVFSGHWLAAFRERMAKRIAGHDEGAAGSVAAALMTGHRKAIPEQVVQALRDSGLAHLLAISGLHIGLVAGFVFFAVRAVLAMFQNAALNYPIKKWAAGAALAAAVLYLLVSGATIPTQRALMMTGMVLLAVVTDRAAITMRPVALAAFVILLLTPESLLSVSFQLSFAAVVSLVAAYEFMRGRAIGTWLRPRSGVGGILAYVAVVGFTTVIAELAIGPFAAFHFNRIVAFGLTANLVAVPIMALWVMPWAVVSYLLMPLGLESWPLGPMFWGIDAIISVATTVSGWPGAVRLIPAIPTLSAVFFAGGGLWLCLWRRPWRLGGVAAIALGLLAAVAGGRQPDILIGGEGKLFALVNPDGELILSLSRGQKRERENWLRRAGQSHAAAWPDPAPDTAGSSQATAWLTCDDLSCIALYGASPPGFGSAHASGGPLVVAIVKDPRAYRDDCRTAAIVISLEPLRGACPSAVLTIDRFDLWRHGAHALWFDDDGIRMETVADGVGSRPWSQHPPTPRQ